ncbi:olfactory receptor 287-like [Nelusetta ayraudi]|uniref:olfactory receptor 287-like n=1 Tax=Nelusetta ayraudi TaxID=303726 RepID=UPI003F6ED573
MLNLTTRVSFFILSAYRLDTRVSRLLLFLATAMLYGTILGANVSLLAVIGARRSLHQPVYLLLCGLFANQLWGSSALFPHLLLQLLAELHIVAVPLCFLQIFCLYSYACVEFCMLTAMSYDRYLAICCPLQYRSRMTARRVALLLSASWLHGAAVCVVPLSVTASLSLCGDVIDKVYCDNFSIVKLACGNTAAINHYGLAASMVMTGAPAGLILYTYVAILRVCVGGAAAAVAARRKAVRTCVPHLASLLNFSFGCLFEVVQSRFDMSLLPAGLRVALSLYFLSGQPLLNPLLYGLSMSSVRQAFRAPPRGAHAAV